MSHPLPANERLTAWGLSLRVSRELARDVLLAEAPAPPPAVPRAPARRSGTPSARRVERTQVPRTRANARARRACPSPTVRRSWRRDGSENQSPTLSAPTSCCRRPARTPRAPPRAARTSPTRPSSSPFVAALERRSASALSPSCGVLRRAAVPIVAAHASRSSSALAHPPRPRSHLGSSFERANLLGAETR